MIALTLTLTFAFGVGHIGAESAPSVSEPPSTRNPRILNSRGIAASDKPSPAARTVTIHGGLNCSHKLKVNFNAFLKKLFKF
jgi:hypothetical protein